MKATPLLLVLFVLTGTVNAFTVGVDLVPVTQDFDNFNDGVDTATNFGNMASAGESGGVASVTIPPNVPDPQFEFPTPATISPFSTDDFPHFRVHSRSTAAGDAQLFPLPADAGTVLGYANSVNSFGEVQLTFLVPGPSGAGLRFDPLGMGTANIETIDFDYIQLDQYPTISLGEFDRDGGMDGWVVNAQIQGAVATAATSALSGTTSGNDPILTKGGFAIDTSVYTIIEIRAAFDPLSVSRFEFFWSTTTFPGPAGGQSVPITAELVRDGAFHVYRFDMSDEAAWDGSLNLLRLDPLADADASSGRDFSIDYVRIIAGAGVADGDGDGLPDNVETNTMTFNGPRDTGTNPALADSDNDTFDDGTEVRLGTDPTDVLDFPMGSIDGYDTSPAVYAIDAPITSNFPVISSGTPDSFSITPTLPTGLVFDTDTGEISGTPTVTSPPTTYTITVVFVGGAVDTFGLVLEVTTPSLVGYSENPAIYTRGVPIVANTPILQGEAPVSFSVSPDLPDGLSFDTVSGAISGTPNVFVPATNFTITAFYNTSPDSSLVLSIRIDALPLVTVDPAELITDFAPIGEFNTDGDLEGWVVAGRGAPHSASVSGGLATYATNPVQWSEGGPGGDDPQFSKAGLGLDTSGGAFTVLEIRMRQNNSPPQFVEFFWGDGSGGISAQRRTQINAGDVPDDNDFHVFQFNMEGVFVGSVDAIRLDPGNLANTTFDFDYIRLGRFGLPQGPEILGLEFNELDEAEITWRSEDGASYNLEATTDLVNWAPINATPISASPGDTTTFPDVDSILFRRRYYRVVKL